MIFPICGFDAKNNVLCPQCEGKVDSGVLTKADVEASVTLAKIAKTTKEIENFSLYSCKEFEGNFILSLAKNDIMIIRQSRTIYRLLQDNFKQKIWLVEADETDKKFIEDLFFPTKILAINVVWSKGIEKTKVPSIRPPHRPLGSPTILGVGVRFDRWATRSWLTFDGSP